MISKICPICNKTGAEPGQNGLCDCVMKLFDHYDFKGIAEAFAKGDLNWHEAEWRDFITMIEQRAVQKEHTRLLNEIEKMLNYKHERFNGCEYFQALEEVKKLLQS